MGRWGMKPCRCNCGCREFTGLTIMREIKSESYLSPGSDSSSISHTHREKESRCFQCQINFHKRAPTEKEMIAALQEGNGVIITSDLRSKVAQELPRVYRVIE